MNTNIFLQYFDTDVMLYFDTDVTIKFMFVHGMPEPGITLKKCFLMETILGLLYMLFWIKRDQKRKN